MKRVKRAAERKHSLTGFTVDRIIFEDISDTYNHALNAAKDDYFNSKVRDAKGDSQSLFKITNKLMGRTCERQLPVHTSKAELAESFSDYFEDKIIKIRSGLESSKANIQPFSPAMEAEIEPPYQGTPLTEFRPATLEEVTTIISKSKSKSCSLDPIPTTVLKDCIAEVAPAILDVINSSISSSTVPSYFKHALVTPLLKKNGLDSDIFKNYRPVSNLPYMSKLLEKVIAARLDEHMEENQLNDPMQSAYKKFHSTETALLRVQNDIAVALENGSGAVLIMLDLSSAFDTIDHSILLQRLQNHYGITGDALRFLESYLIGRTQSVVIEGTESGKRILKTGVPQGSGLGPKKYVAYSKPVGKIILFHKLQYKIYADDGQIYIVLSPGFNPHDVVSSLEACVCDINKWMTRNMLKLNDEKTELIYFQSKFIHNPIPTPPLNIGGNIIQPVSCVKNLGCYLDSKLTMETQVNSVVKSCSYYIHMIGKIRRHLDDESCKTIINSIVTSRLDYCNSMLLGCPDYLIKRLQKVQNMSARVISRTRKYDHISGVIESLHWLPVEDRITYKILTIVFKALHGLAPSYLTELLSPHKTARFVRSCDEDLLFQPRHHVATYADMSFHIGAPRKWNKLPHHLRVATDFNTFKAQLKTHLFKKAYNIPDKCTNTVKRFEH